MSTFVAFCFFGSIAVLVISMILADHYEGRKLRRAKESYKQSNDALMDVIDSMRQRERTQEEFRSQRKQRQYS